MKISRSKIANRFPYLYPEKNKVVCKEESVIDELKRSRDEEGAKFDVRKLRIELESGLMELGNAVDTIEDKAFKWYETDLMAF